MDYKKALYEELQEGIILNLYGRITVGTMTHDFKERAIEYYMNNPIFHAEAKGMAHAIMALIERHQDSPLQDLVEEIRLTTSEDEVFKLIDEFYT